MFVIIFSLKPKWVFCWSGQKAHTAFTCFHSAFVPEWLQYWPLVCRTRLSGLLSCNWSANQSSLPSQSSSHCQASLLSPSPSGNPLFFVVFLYCLLLFLPRQRLCLPPVSSDTFWRPSACNCFPNRLASHFPSKVTRVEWSLATNKATALFSLVMFSMTCCDRRMPSLRFTTGLQGQITDNQKRRFFFFFF